MLLDFYKSPANSDTLRLTNNEMAAISRLDFVFVDVANGVRLAVADPMELSGGDISEGTVIGCVYDGTIGSGDVGQVWVRPGALIAGFTGLTVGDPLYLSFDTPGAYQQDLTSYDMGFDIVLLGKAVNTTTIIFNPLYVGEQV